MLALHTGVLTYDLGWHIFSLLKRLILCWQVYAAPLQGGSRAVVLFNRYQQLDENFPVQNLTVYWKSIGIPMNATVRVRCLHLQENCAFSFACGLLCGGGTAEQQSSHAHL